MWGLLVLELSLSVCALSVSAKIGYFTTGLIS